MNMSHENKSLIASVDFGSTHACARIYSHNLDCLAESVYPSHFSEPESCWKVFCKLLESITKGSGIKAKSVSCLGISVQRNTFLIWNRETSEPVTQLCSWQETKSSQYAARKNNTSFLKALNQCSKMLFKVVPKTKFKMASHYRLTCIFSVTRLAHIFEEDQALYEKCRNGEFVYGGLETWLLWRLTGGRAWCTDLSCISATGAFDPSILGLSPFILNFLKISPKIFPAICPTSTFFGEIRCGPLSVNGSEGERVRVTALIGDSQAAMLGEGCLEVGDAKITLGTGSFLNVNIGSQLVPPNTGFYPVVGWAESSRKNNSISCENSPDTNIDTVTFLIEGFNSDAGSTLVKLKHAGMYDESLETSPFFVPSSLGVRKKSLKNQWQSQAAERKLAFVNTNSTLTEGGIFTGLSLGHSDPTLMRQAALYALMDSIVMAARLLFVKGVNKELVSKIKVLKVNGNLTRSDWLMQRLADTLGIFVERNAVTETCCLGAAIAAGVGAGIWNSYKQAVQCALGAKNKRPCETIKLRFEPNSSARARMEERYLYWTSICVKTIVTHESVLSDSIPSVSLDELLKTSS